MKGRLNKALMMVVALNFIALAVVMYLAFEAGAQSDGQGMFALGNLKSGPASKVLAMSVSATGWVRRSWAVPVALRSLARDRRSLQRRGGVRRAEGDNSVAAPATPTEAMAASLAALGPEHRALLVAMLDVPPGPAAERDVAASLRRHHEGGLAHAPVELIDRLADHFLRVIA